MKRILVLLAILAGALPAAADDYVPLTEMEALSYLQTASTADLIADIIRLDALEHAVPVVFVPDVGLVYLDDGRLSIAYLGPITVSVAGGALFYSLTFAPIVVKLDSWDPWPDRLLAGGIGFGAGVVLVGGLWFASVVFGK